MLVTCGERCEAGILRQLRHPDDLNERLKELLLGAGDRDVAVGGREELERHDARVRRQGSRRVSIPADSHQVAW